MNKFISLPITHQPAGSTECLIACIKMVLEFYKDDISYETLVTDLQPWINAEERHLQGAAIYLCKKGYVVHFQYHDPSIIDTILDSITEKDKDTVVAALTQTEHTETTQHRRKKLSLDIEFIEAGGKYSTAIPTLDTLDANVQKSIPTIICVKQKIWSTDFQMKSNHYVVVVGKKNGNYLVHDPDSKKVSPYEVAASKLLMAWYATGAYTLWF